MKITRGYETFSAESIAEIHFVLEVSFLILRKQEAEMKEWYQISAEEVKKKMETSEHGLTTEEAAKRLAQYGENVLAEGKKKSVFAVVFGQFADLLVGILIVAAVISACSGNPESTFVILVVIVLNALLGTVQYVKAEKSLESLKDLTSPNASAALRREGGDSGEGSRAGRPSAAGGGRHGGGGRQNPAQLFTAGE